MSKPITKNLSDNIGLLEEHTYFPYGILASLNILWDLEWDGGLYQLDTTSNYLGGESQWESVYFALACRHVCEELPELS